MVYIRKLLFCYFVICLFETYASTFDVSQLTLDEINSMFGEDGCIEGFLHSTELPHSLQFKAISKVINEKEKRKDPVPSQFGAYGTHTNNMSTNFLNSNGKSPMSLINELAIFNKVQHQYQIINEEGPAHQKLFSVILQLGDEEYSADGASVKKAKHSVASKALQQTRYKHPALKASHSKGLGKRNCGLYTDQTTESKSPISLVHEIATKSNLPVSFEIESEEGPPHMRTFVTKCIVGDKTTTGQGNGKKLSKKIAAERMLEELKTHTPSSLVNLGSCTKRRKRKASKGKKRFQNFIKSIKKAIFGDSNSMSTKGSYSHQFEPEIHVSDNNAVIENEQNSYSKVSGVQSLQNIPNNLFNGGRSHRADSFNNMKKMVPLSGLKQPFSQNQAEKPKDRLKDLAQLRDFQVHFTDFKKGNHSEILTLVALTTDPPQICLGSGSTTDASHNKAALTALKVLSKIDVDSMVPIGIDIKKEIAAQRDRIHLAELTVKKSGGLSFQK